MSEEQKAGMWRTTFWLVMIGLLVAYIYYRGRGEGDSFASFRDKPLPSLASGGTWVNAPQALTWEALGGDVVWLEFSFIH